MYVQKKYKNDCDKNGKKTRELLHNTFYFIPQNIQATLYSIVAKFYSYLFF